MSPLSDALRTLLDDISAVVAGGGVPADALLAQLDALWRAERPDDLAGLTALMASLRARPDEALLAVASERRAEEKGRLVAKGVAVSSPTMSVDPFDVKKGGDEGQESGWVYPVFFGTNRAPNPAPDQGFSARRADAVTYGRCEVRIPATHRFGEIGNAFYRRWLRLQFTEGAVPKCGYAAVA
jgi:hypothetical protein